MTTLHSGGKFEGKAYSTSGGLHGVGVSVVNALSTETIVEVARDKKLYRQTFSQGRRRPRRSRTVGAAPNRRGTTVIFTPDPEIFGADAHVQPGAPLQARPLEGLSLRRGRDSLALRPVARLRRGSRNRRLPVPRRPGGPSRGADWATAPAVTNQPFTGRQDFPNDQGSAEWAVAWPLYSDGVGKLLLQHHPDARRRHA